MDEKKRRKEENEDIIRRMKLGDMLVRTPISETWFPPRPLTIKGKIKPDVQNKIDNVISFSLKRETLTSTD